MDFNDFFTTCGRSPFAEEFRGDLEEAWYWLQQNQPDESLIEPEQHAEYLRCVSLHSILSGRLACSYESLNKLHGLLEQLPHEWGLRWSNYTMLTHFSRRYPPVIHFYHERGRPVSISMLKEIIGPVELEQLYRKNFNTYCSRGAELDRVLCIALGSILWFPLTARNLTTKFHPLSPKGPWHTPDADSEARLAQVSNGFVAHQDMAAGSGEPEIGSYLNRLIVELCQACQSKTLSVALKRLSDTYEISEDIVGMGNCKMIEADNLLSPVFASPLSLNLTVVDQSSSLVDEHVWDAIEFNLPFEYSPEAKECYDSATTLFQKAGCKRGQAAILLRQGCCLHVLAIPLRRTKQERLKSLKEADQKFQAALKLFGGDEANVQIVKVHQILLKISKGEINTFQVRLAGKAVGQWGIDAMNENLVHFLGLLTSRFALQEWRKFSRLDSSLLAWEFAEAMFEALGDTLPMFQALVCQASMHNELFNSSASRILIEKAVSMFEVIRDYYEARITLAPDTVAGKNDRGTLLSSKFNTIWTFSMTVALIYIRVGDHDAFTQWQSRLANFIQHDESFQIMRNASQPPSFNTSSTHQYPPRTEIWEKAMAEDSIKVKYASAELEFHRHLDEGNIEKAECALRHFLDDSSELEHVPMRYFYCILACERIGDSARARSILDSIDDDCLLNGRLLEFAESTKVDSPFWRTLSTVAQNALIYSIYAQDFERGYRLVDMITQASPDFFISSVDGVSELAFRLAQYGIIMMENHHPELALSSLLQACQMIELRRLQTIDVDARMGSSMAGWQGEVYLNLARLCLRFRDLDSPVALMDRYEHDHPTGISWNEHALLFTESRRARAVLDSLQIRHSQRELVQPSSASIPTAIHKLRTLRSLLSLQSPTQAEIAEIAELQDEIRELETNDAISPAMNFIDEASTTVEPILMYQSIPPDAVVIQITFGARGFIAFATTKDGIQDVQQGPNRLSDIRKPVMKFMQITRGIANATGEVKHGRKRLLDNLSMELSSVLIAPFSTIIRSKKNIIFSCSEPLTAFPFSALTFDGKPLILHAVVSHIPSMTILFYLSQRQSAVEARAVSVFAKSPNANAPGEDEFNTRNETQGVNLHMAAIEAVNIARMFATWPVEASNLSRQEFCNYIQGNSSIIHVGTHGYIDSRNPLLSSISIGQNFRVLDMSTIRSTARLLVFAACLSGLGKATLSTDVLGFSHVVLSSGCQAYIGTLWEVSDLASMMIMTLFYRYLKSNPNISTAEAIREAQVEFIQLDSDRAEVLLTSMLEDWTSPDENGNLPADFVPDQEFILSIWKMTLSQIDWADPYYWASFMLIGYGDLRFRHAEPISDS
jgi:CHAT domain-containing protein